MTVSERARQRGRAGGCRRARRRTHSRAGARARRRMARVRHGFRAHQRRELVCMTRVRSACTDTAEQTRCPRVTQSHSLPLGITGNLDIEDFCAAESMNGKNKQPADLLVQAAAAHSEEEIVGLRSPRLPMKGSVSPSCEDRGESSRG